MLQQTQVETVKPYFRRFLAALPTIAPWPRPTSRQVLRLWEGLGYYRRARQLHQAARKIVADHDGRFPRDPEAVTGCRASAATRPARSSPSPSTSGGRSWRPTPCGSSAGCWPTTADHVGGRAEAALGGGRGRAAARGAGRFNQALMELGSEVCRAPRAGVRGLPGGKALPGPAARAARRDPAAQAAAAIRRRLRGGGARPPPRTRALDPMARRPPLGRAVGFSPLCHPGRSGGRDPSRVDRQRAAADGSDHLARRHRKTLRHGVTRFRITLECYEAEYVSHNGGGAETRCRSGSGPPSRSTIR